MTTAIVPVTVEQRAIAGEEVNTVDARQLHDWLKVGKYFSNWMRDRIRQYQFVEGVDFVVIAKSGNNPRGGRNFKEYLLTIDMAKELAMVERTERGRQARRYFIECERKARTATMTHAQMLDKASDMALEFLTTPESLREILLTYVERDRENRIRSSVREKMMLTIPRGVKRQLPGPR